MKHTWLQMGMPITLNIADIQATESDFAIIMDFFRRIDEQFSPYKKTSELSRINNKEITTDQYSHQMRHILQIAELTRLQTQGYFDIAHNGKIDTSGIVKGWAIHQASKILQQRGYSNFYIDAGGDIDVFGKSTTNKKWSIGIKNPFNTQEIIKVLSLTDCGVATSGSYNRGQHIYNPKNSSDGLNEIICVTVIGPNVYEADRFATAAFAMGKKGIEFIEHLSGFEGYQIDSQGTAILTSNFEKYLL